MTRRPTLLPERQLDQVVRTLYRQADEAGWETLNSRDRSRMYTQWVDPKNPVGAILTRFLTPEAARSWIKDGPMKEYTRSNRGTGRYARFGRQGGTTPLDIVRHALGPTAVIEEGSDGVKPSRCHARSEERRYLVIWGDQRSFKDLLWAALRAATEDDDEVHIVVLEPPGSTTTTENRDRQQVIAARCGIPLHYLHEIRGTRPDARQT
jgi:hypothetical protein